MAYLKHVQYALEKSVAVLRWELLEIVEQDGVLIRSTLYRPMGDPTDSLDAYQLPFNAENNARQLISAVLFDGFEPVNQSVVVLPDGQVQTHWMFRLQTIT